MAPRQAACTPVQGWSEPGPTSRASYVGSWIRAMGEHRTHSHISGRPAPASRSGPNGSLSAPWPRAKNKRSPVTKASYPACLWRKVAGVTFTPVDPQSRPDAISRLEGMRPSQLVEIGSPGWADCQSVRSVRIETRVFFRLFSRVTGSRPTSSERGPGGSVPLGSSST